MDRRTFVLLTGAASSALVRPLTTLGAPRPPGAAGSGRLRFELDEKRRWSLWYSSEGQPRLLIKDAAVGVRARQTVTTGQPWNVTIDPASMNLGPNSITTVRVVITAPNSVVAAVSDERRV